MDDVLEFQSKIGNGGQAEVGLYKPKATAKKLFNAKIEQYAVKTYLFPRRGYNNDIPDARKII